MKRLTKRFMTITMSIVMVVVMFSAFTIPAEALLVPASGNIEDRIHQLRTQFPIDSYFSEDGQRCTHNFDQTCPNCSLHGVLQRFGYSTTGVGNAWTCAALAWFSYFYTYGVHWNGTGQTGIPSNGHVVSSANARFGDIFVWTTPHWGVRLGNNSSFFHSNSSVLNGTNRVRSTSFTGALRHVVRANNYDQINNLGTSFATAIPMLSGTNRHVSVTTTHPMRFYSFTPTQSRTYTIESFNNGLSDPFGWIFNDSQTLLAQDDNSGGNRNFRIEMHLVSGRRYFIRAGCFQNGTGNYQIRIT